MAEIQAEQYYLDRLDTAPLATFVFDMHYKRTPSPKMEQEQPALWERVCSQPTLSSFPEKSTRVGAYAKHCCSRCHRIMMLNFVPPILMCSCCGGRTDDDWLGYPPSAPCPYLQG